MRIFVMPQVELWALTPFAIMLLSIAVMPLIAGKWWENNLHKLYVALALSVPTGYYLIANGMGENLQHQILKDYLPFIILLGALFIVTGGIRINGDIQARPRNNTLIMAIGYLLASFIGTTGAAMLLIRPLLEFNKQREYKVHTVVVFIALVANCGGILTPLGDPPLFLLYLRGAEFSWFMNMLPEWLTVGAIILTGYYFVDKYIYYHKEHIANVMADFREKTPLYIKGRINIIYLICIILTVAYVNPSHLPQMGAEDAPLRESAMREIILIIIALFSILTTRRGLREANQFSWEPLIEVAVVFIGIFVTMTPALIYLNAHATSLGLQTPDQFFYGAGFLSAFLDNSPTAVAFHTVAQGIPHATDAVMVAGVPQDILRAISLGAVFFGAMTYIGNGPNFMVKSIAEHNGVKMPSFFGYMFRFSLIIMLPVYIIVQLIFL
ncbi:MAG: sodium:proton antiporter [Alistipes sp.]|nr:sodium:proton antiporter [Alistipes sp.]